MTDSPLRRISLTNIVEGLAKSTEDIADVSTSLAHRLSGFILFLHSVSLLLGIYSKYYAFCYPGHYATHFGVFCVHAS